jgi:hypothetical protein
MVYELVAEVLESDALANEAEPEVPVAVLAVRLRALAEAGLGKVDHSWAHLHPSPHHLPHMVASAVRAEHLQVPEDQLAQSEY